MTKTVQTRVACQACQALLDYTIYPEINLATDPQLKTKILDQSLFQLTCSQCGDTHTYQYDFSLQDPSNNYHLLTCYEPQALPIVADQVSAAVAQAKDQGKSLPRMRVVGHPIQVREKITLFDLGLDDWILEIYKYKLLEAYAQEKGVALDLDRHQAHLLLAGPEQAMFYFYQDETLDKQTPFNQATYEDLASNYPVTDRPSHALVDSKLAQSLVKGG